jgi:Holliday junction resolvase RusA-like endonuclease
LKPKSFGGREDWVGGMNLDSKVPPQHGELEILLQVPAVSRQANSTAKQQITDLVRARTKPLEYLLDDDVTVDIEWMLHESKRWETDASADVDNIVKPLLDALCGPEGILIDDCQVRSFSSTWKSWDKCEDRVLIRIKYDADHYMPKDDLVFVRIKDALCYPVPREVREKALSVWIDWLRTALVSRSVLERLTGEYYPARYLAPRGFIHRSRLKGFDVYTPEELAKLSSCKRS